jgi:hypothetical protein
MLKICIPKEAVQISVVEDLSQINVDFRSTKREYLGCKVASNSKNKNIGDLYIGTN